MELLTCLNRCVGVYLMHFPWFTDVCVSSLRRYYFPCRHCLPFFRFQLHNIVYINNLNLLVTRWRWLGDLTPNPWRRMSHVATCGLNSLKNLDRRGFLALQNYCGENTLLAQFWSYIWNFYKRNFSLSEFHTHQFLQQVAWRSSPATPFCNKGNLKRFTTCTIDAEWDLNLESTFNNRISGSEILFMGLAWYHVHTIVIRILLRHRISGPVSINVSNDAIR